MSKSTLCVLLLDASASMKERQDFYDGTISGINEYRASLVNSPQADSIYFGIWTFSVPGSLAPLFEPELAAKTPATSADTYLANGMSTALYEAIVGMHDEIDKWAAVRNVQDGEDPDIVFVVYTDGMNNAGKVTREAALAKNKEATDTKGWQVVYLGVAEDQYATSLHYMQASSMGTYAGSTGSARKSAVGAKSSWDTISSSTAHYTTLRAAGHTVASEDFLVLEGEVTSPKTEDEKDEEA